MLLLFQNYSVFRIYLLLFFLCFCRDFIVFLVLTVFPTLCVRQYLMMVRMWKKIIFGNCSKKLNRVSSFTLFILVLCTRELNNFWFIFSLCRHTVLERPTSWGHWGTWENEQRKGFATKKDKEIGSRKADRCW